MKLRICAALVTLTLACHGDALHPSHAPATMAEAMAAYRARDWTTCSTRFAEIARTSVADARTLALYDAASCDALAGNTDAAFEHLLDAVDGGYHDVTHLEADSDLRPLHSDSRWAHAVASAKAREAAWEQSLGDPGLRRELLALAADDQAARDAWLATDPNNREAQIELAKKVQAVDERDTARLKEIVDARGWPGIHMVGADGASAAWLLAQHADQAPELQEAFLEQMKIAVDHDDASPADYAYLYDRVAVAAHRQQLYGTQFNGTEPFPIEDEAHVDARRAAVGLPSMAEYRKKLLEVYGTRP